jgi:hypothetical protein
MQVQILPLALHFYTRRDKINIMDKIIPALLLFIAVLSILVSSGCTTNMGDNSGCDPNSPDYDSCMQAASGPQDVPDLPPPPPPPGSV